jgi:hypothetical protein
VMLAFDNNFSLEQPHLTLERAIESVGN